MNTIYFANLKTGERAAVKVGQGGVDWYEQTHNRDQQGKLPASAPKRRRTMAEAGDAMARKGYVRWPRRKEIPGFQEISLRRAA